MVGVRGNWPHDTPSGRQGGGCCETKRKSARPSNGDGSGTAGSVSAVPLIAANRKNRVTYVTIYRIPGAAFVPFRRNMAANSPDYERNPFRHFGRGIIGSPGDFPVLGTFAAAGLGCAAVRSLPAFEGTEAHTDTATEKFKLASLLAVSRPDLTIISTIFAAATQP